MQLLRPFLLSLTLSAVASYYLTKLLLPATLVQKLGSNLNQQQQQNHYQDTLLSTTSNSHSSSSSSSSSSTSPSLRNQRGDKFARARAHLGKHTVATTTASFLGKVRKCPAPRYNLHDRACRDLLRDTINNDDDNNSNSNSNCSNCSNNR